MTTREAFSAGVSRLRLPVWNPAAYIKIDIIQQGKTRFIGPWFHLYDRATQEAIGEPTPQHALRIGDNESDYEAYTGPLDKDDAA